MRAKIQLNTRLIRDGAVDPVISSDGRYIYIGLLGEGLTDLLQLLYNDVTCDSVQVVSSLQATADVNTIVKIGAASDFGALYAITADTHGNRKLRKYDLEFKQLSAANFGSAVEVIGLFVVGSTVIVVTQNSVLFYDANTLAVIGTQAFDGYFIRAADVFDLIDSCKGCHKEFLALELSKEGYSALAIYHIKHAHLNKVTGVELPAVGHSIDVRVDCRREFAWIVVGTVAINQKHEQLYIADDSLLKKDRDDLRLYRFDCRCGLKIVAGVSNAAYTTAFFLDTSSDNVIIGAALSPLRDEIKYLKWYTLEKKCDPKKPVELVSCVPCLDDLFVGPNAIAQVSDNGKWLVIGTSQRDGFFNFGLYRVWSN